MPDLVSGARPLLFTPACFVQLSLSSPNIRLIYSTGNLRVIPFIWRIRQAPDKDVLLIRRTGHFIR